MKTALLLLLLFVEAVCPAILFARISPTEQLQFDRLSAFDDLPSEEVTRILQDSNGFLWIATNNGFCRYDGYRIRTYKDNLFTSGLLPSNAIRCLTEDKENRLWIGTNNGVCIMDLTTGNIRKVDDGRVDDRIVSEIYTSSDGSVWMGLDEGLFRYVPGRDSLVLYDRLPDGRRLKGVKTLLEDSRGRLWIGTWADGLLRYDRQGDRFTAYPRLDKRNSVHFLFEDSEHTLWAGTWDAGLHRLEQVDSPATIRWKTFRHEENCANSLSDNIIYSIEEDIHTHSLWVGTRSGLSILNLSEPEKDQFVNYLPENPSYPLPYNELNAIVRDRSGIFWLGMMGGGVYSVNRQTSSFDTHRLEAARRSLYSSSIRSLFLDSDETLWLGLGSYGLMIQPQGASEPFFFPGAKQPNGKATYNHSVTCFMQPRDSREIWMATWGDGVSVYNKDRQDMRVYKQEDTPWIPDNYILSLLEDRLHNIWIGGHLGLSVLLPDGTGVQLTDHPTTPDNTSLRYAYNYMVETRGGQLWLGTNRCLIKVSGDLSQPHKMNFHTYSHTSKQVGERLPLNNIQCMFEDSRGRLWVGSEGVGLNLYDPEKDAFACMNNRYGLLADAIFNIREDEKGDLWMGTNIGLTRLSVSEDAASAVSRIYTTTDGLTDNMFLRNASCRTADGKLYFGGHNGYNSFYPAEVNDKELAPVVAITDISVFNTSLDDMPYEQRSALSPKAPLFTEKIRLEYDQNNFSIEFSSLSYLNPSKNKYAYRLDGYDTDWQYTDASNRTANYSSLPAGTYLFRLKGSNENGLWSDAGRTLTIEVLPPVWKTTGAYTLYILFCLLAIAIAGRIVRNRIREKQLRHLEAMEKTKSEEVNHAKLQFFTNVTHEFMTPLTILSASLDELNLEAPQNARHYSLMYDNINRLIRLIQQILEFRKAETGNLKLKVSEGDILAFIRKEVESFRPLMKKRHIHFLLRADEQEIRGYFDSDKLDKILYNLLSNASKYNKEGGTVEVSAGLDKSGRQLLFSVKDDGPGFTKEAKKTLFKRFYEGDYRRFNTLGSGIGLSLTRDLVDLYGGTIRVESEEGQGAAFVVGLPIARESFTEEQIDERPALLTIEGERKTEGEAGSTAPVGEEADTVVRHVSKPTLLLVEDNDDLLALMVRLLNREYTILVAHNGMEALTVVEAEEVDLIVSDVMMPVMDGIALCKSIKANFDLCHIPILLLTAKNKEEDRIEAYNSGADSFLNKPFNLSLLHARIRNLLRTRERTARDFKKQLVFEAQELDYTSMDEDFLRRAIDCVQKHLDDAAFDQSQFMDAMGTSKSTLYKKLKSLTGLNTSAFIRNIRLKAACQIIDEKKRIRISELAYAVGFNDPKYFSACFRKEFGLLPTEYMEKFAEESPGEGDL